MLKAARLDPSPFAAAARRTDDPHGEHTRVNLDFSLARTKHVVWKARLRSFLDGHGRLTAEQATQHTECELGKWLYSEGIRDYGSLPEMQTLVREHELLHRTIRAIVDLKAAGKLIDAEAEFRKVEPMSSIIVDLLDALEDRVARAAA